MGRRCSHSNLQKTLVAVIIDRDLVVKQRNPACFDIGNIAYALYDKKASGYDKLRSLPLSHFIAAYFA